MTYDLLLFLHVIGATVLLGSGAGIAFFMLISNRSRDPALIAHVSGIVVLADGVFTATAAILQPITGYLLTQQAGWSLTEGWVVLSLGLYVLVGCFWLPVVWIQIRLHYLAHAAHAAGMPLPARYHQLYRWWFACGWPAFAAVLGILWLMLTKPVL